MQIRLDRKNTDPLYHQLYSRLRELIARQQVAPGNRIPSVRNLATELCVSRGTVELAYQLLVSEGYCIARGAAGTFVSSNLKPHQIVETLESESAGPPRNQVDDAAANEVKPLQSGLPALDAFPKKLWARLASRRARATEDSVLAYPDLQGLFSLRNALASYLGVSRGISCSPDQIIVTAGYRDALGLVTRSLLSPGDVGWFEEPGYFLAREMLTAAGLRLISVPVDEQGLSIFEGRRRADDARFVVTTPTHHSPLGMALSLHRRLALLDWARNKDAWIIEDDYDSEYRYSGRPLPALKSLDHSGRVIYAGTFSKVLFPALRLGYLVVPPDTMPRFRAALQQFGSPCSNIQQGVVSDFMTEGHFARHLKRTRDLYATRRRYLREALENRLSDCVFLDDQAGGMHLLARLPNGLDDIDIARTARANGLGIKALSDWYKDSPSRQGLLLGFTNVANPQEAYDVVEQLSMVLRAH